MSQTERIFYWLLLISATAGFATSYFPGVIGQPASFWLSDLIATLSYFTIISNIAVGVLAASQLFFPNHRLGFLLSSMSAQTAIAVYITVTGVIYHLLLADTWNPQGIDLVSDELLHTVTPILYVVFWFRCIRGKNMPIENTLKTLIVPAIFLVYWLIRGPLVGTYPYFFIDVDQYGYATVLMNSVGLCMVFWGLALVYWAINKFTTPLYV